MRFSNFPSSELRRCARGASDGPRAGNWWGWRLSPAALRLRCIREFSRRGPGATGATVRTRSTSRQIREDYFGRGAVNASYFAIPIGVPGGTGPNSGRFGTLGRDTFRGPGFHNVDVSLVKDTPVGRAGNAERVALEFRAEIFNVFNLVNFGLPANTVLGPGFGLISRTAGTSRQIQLSLKLLY